jgi:serine/threonine protein kinase
VYINLPFYGNDVDLLYKNISKGSYNKIPRIYGNELRSIIRNLLQVNPDNRINTSEILKMDIISEKIKQFEISTPDDEDIAKKKYKLPKKALFLKEQLPQTDYED